LTITPTGSHEPTEDDERWRTIQRALTTWGYTLRYCVITVVTAAARSGDATTANTSLSAAQGAAANDERSLERTKFVKRAKASRWAKAFGLITLFETAAASTLVALKVTNIGIAGYIAAVTAVFVGVIPLFSERKQSAADQSPDRHQINPPDWTDPRSGSNAASRVRSGVPPRITRRPRPPEPRP
jgi:hypothetical protein